MTQQELFKTREEKAAILEKARIPGRRTARGEITLKKLIWTIELTPVQSRTSAVITAKMRIDRRTLQRTLRTGRQLDLIRTHTEPGQLSRFQINWTRLADLNTRTRDTSNAAPGSPPPPPAVPPPAFPFHLHTSLISKKIPSSSIHEYETEDALWKCWGRDELLTKADLVDPRSTDRLFEYAVQRGRFQRHDLDRIRFEALCVCCARRGIIPGALLTKCVFGTAAAVNFIAADSDMETARQRLRQRTPKPAEAARPLAAALGIPAEAATTPVPAATIVQRLKAFK